ncbi:four helix bundle protein [Chitinophaga sp. HK235]|uniref:four helix bundle protein n=1 Tax=Chitinophaga sp. HK235 TaxID=2952571 RepID=UPI001BA5544C|nr:four helix bundle protein [Chitinophaga sp. HK235]
MNKYQLQERTKKFHIDVIRLCEILPKNIAAYEIAKQLIRSAGSVGANYRAVCLAKSQTDFVYKIKVVLEEADESLYWLEILKETGIADHTSLINPLLTEAKELVFIFSASRKKANDTLTKQNIKIAK